MADGSLEITAEIVAIWGCGDGDAGRVTRADALSAGSRIG
jgi:hypothetical protein